MQLFFFADVAYFKDANKLLSMINAAALHTSSKPPFGLLMCYFVYKVITNKVFKKVTCQLLGWWIPFPQWKHASAEASNFLSCTPPKLQCRDCLVINRACTVPSLCMRLGSRERVRGEVGIPSMHQTTGLVFSIHCAGYSPPPSSSYTLLTRELFVFLIHFSSRPRKKKKKKTWGQFHNVGFIWDVVSLIFNCGILPINWPTVRTASPEWQLSWIDLKMNRQLIVW